MIVAGKDQLRGWKEIADYLARDERTVKRWEKQRGLPVRRVPGSGRANVYVLVPELETWLVAAKSSFAGQPEAIVEGSPEEAEPLFETVLKREPQLPPAAAKGSPRRSLLTLGVAGGLVLAAALVALRPHILGAPARMKTPPVPTATARVYISPQAEVDELYLQGVYFHEKRTPASLEQARQSFERAIARDPNHAPAYAGLANTYLLLREFSTMPSEEAYAKAKVAAERAIALDPNLADAHTALGFIDFFSGWNAAAATKQFQAALRLDPNSALAHHWYGSMLTHEGRYAEALRELNEAQRLQPTSSAILSSKALALGLGGHRNEAVDMLQTLATADPSAVSVHRILAILSLIEPRDISRFLDESRRLAETRNDPEDLAIVEAATEAFRRGGEAAMWSAILAKERQLHPPPQPPPYLRIEAEAALRQDGGALSDLNMLADQRMAHMIGIAQDPVLARLRSNPEFQKILAKVGLPSS